MVVVVVAAVDFPVHRHLKFLAPQLEWPAEVVVVAAVDFPVHCWNRLPAPQLWLSEVTVVAIAGLTVETVVYPAHHHLELPAQQLEPPAPPWVPPAPPWVPPAVQNPQCQQRPLRRRRHPSAPLELCQHVAGMLQ